MTSRGPLVARTPDARRGVLKRHRPSGPPKGPLLVVIVFAVVALTTGTACARRGEAPTTGENVTSVARQADRLVGREVTAWGM